MVYEKQVRSFAGLMEAVRVLDQDAGIRLIGEIGGSKCFVFVTRFGRKFTMMRYSVNARTGTPGKRLEAVEFDSVESLGEALRRVAPRRIRAYVY